MAEDTEGDTEVELDPEDPAEAELMALVEASCMQVDRCRCGAVVFGDETCLDYRTRSWTNRLAWGRDHALTYDPACVQDQIQKLPNLGCQTAASGEMHLCDDFCAVFHGDKNEGESCIGFDAVVSDCAQGLTCASGTCTTPCSVISGLTLGQTCADINGNDFDDCARGLYCDWNSRTCLELPAQGQPCDYQCAENLFCDWNTSTCQPTVGEGQSCVNGIGCDAGLACVYQGDSGPPNYDPIQTCLRPGGPGEPCVDYNCELGLFCSNQICTTPPELGQPCPEGRCAEDLYCDWTIQQCVEPPSLAGQPCPQGECAFGLWCDQQAMPEPQCRDVFALAQPCTGHSQCDSGYCPMGYCLPRPALGEDCSQTLACASGLVCNGSTCQLAESRGPAVCIYSGW